jgi:hypothetical protein
METMASNKSQDFRKLYASKVLKLGAALFVLQVVLGLVLTNLLADASVSPSILNDLPISTSSRNSAEVLLATRRLATADQNFHMFAWVTCLGIIINLGISLWIVTASFLEHKNSVSPNGNQ